MPFFNDVGSFNYKYTPILSISPAEMIALEQLPDKGKDIILPMMPLRGWVGSKKLDKSIARIEKAIGGRYWIADLDASFLEDNKEKQITGKYPREVFYEVEGLLISDNGYENWFQFLQLDECSKAIPTVQLTDRRQLKKQLEKLYSLNRGVVIRFTLEHINSDLYLTVLQTVNELQLTDILIIFDYEQVSRDILTFAASISSTIKKAHSLVPSALISLSCSSFPSSFSGSRYGEHSIYERLLFNTVSRAYPEIRMIYSDRGSARADKISGGGGIPSPRIDYPLSSDWRFIREEFEDYTAPQAGEKEKLYTKIAKKIMKADFWNADLHVWGTQVIGLTSQGEKFGINSAIRATAVRINIHLHRQLHYDAPQADLLNTDEEWED